VFWVWSDYFRRIMPKSNGQIATVVGGDLRWRSVDLAAPLALPPAERRILCLEQGPTLAYHLRRGSPLPDPVVASIRAAPPGWQWLIRLHPRMISNVSAFVEGMRRQGIENVLVEGPSLAPLSSCLESSDAVLTGFSAGAIEAHDAGLPVVLFEPMAQQLFREPIEAGAMQFSDDPAGIVAALAAAARHHQAPLIRRDRRLALAAMDEVLAMGAGLGKGAA
ncbi:MAG: hypothetical protein SFW09_20930, partial [Hyphomicrobiaceae bacterium]|nr:hypothetical protein [Hyphomicrobiaceae bacterium]